MGRHSNYSNDMYKQLQEIMGRLDSVEKDLKQEKIEHKEDVDRLEKLIVQKDKKIKLLEDDNARLRSIINNDSSNTSVPPSSDQKGGKSANAYNGRKESGRKAGGQKGRKGTTLTKADVKKKLQNGNCQHCVKHLGTPNDQPYIVKYVIDLDVRTVITEVRIHADKTGKYSIPKEYYSDVTYGSNVKALTAALYSEGVMSNERIASFLNTASSGELELSAGSVYQFCKTLSDKAGTSIMHLEELLLNQNVVATDATTVTVNGTQSYIRNFSVLSTVLYRAMKSKSLDALHKISFLEKYTGILIHDHETALYHFGRDHGECNVHIIRYLRKNTEETGNLWSKDLIGLLCEMNQAKKEAIQRGKSALPSDIIDNYTKQYLGLLERGRLENKNTCHNYAKKDEKTLLNRLEKYMHNHLLFLHNFEVPFDDNISERDLRKAKNRQKMAGGFRKDSGQEMYCAILTIVETLKRRRMGIIENIRLLFEGTPAIF